VLGEDHEVFAGALESLGDEGGVLRCDRLDEVRVGDRVVFANALEMRNDARVCGPALDDRIGCLIALHAARILADDESEVAFAWTVREETGPAGVIRVARDLNPEVVVAVDITYATASDQTTESAVAVGQGPVITLLDGGMVGHSWPVRAFDRAASSLGLRWQPEVVRGGVSEAGRAERMLGLPALALLVAIENPHSHDEIADLNDIASVRDLLVAGVRELIHGSRQ
jgi:endoglucanase